MVYLERKFLGWVQNRFGPNRAGPFGIFQSVADAVKLIFKEEVFPERRDKILYFLSPLITVLFSFIPFSIIPIGKKPLIADIKISLLLIIVFSSLSVYGVILAGISSGSKYPLIGSLRACAQVLSYEIPLIISIIAISLQAETFSLREIIERQKIPYIFPQFLGFFSFFLATLADSRRIPFDLPEAESEIVGGYNTEYSGIKFALFFLGEYAHLILLSSLIVILYLGGGNFFVFLIKLLIFIFIFYWIRASFPRIRLEELLSFSWKYLIPLSFINLIIVSIFKVIK
jgi:NADH-quinone oxidoreductase subunit H